MASNKTTVENDRLLSIQSMVNRYELDKNIGDIAETISSSDTPIILIIGDKKTNKENFISKMEKKTIFDSKIFDIFDSRKIKIINCGESEKARIRGIIPLATSITVLFDISNVFNSKMWEVIYEIKENEHKEGLAIVLQIKNEISSQDISQITDSIRNTLAEKGFSDVPVFIDSNETDETGNLKKFIKKRAKDYKIDPVKAIDDLKAALEYEIMTEYDFTKEKYNLNRSIKSDISEKDNDINSMIAKKKTEAPSSFSMIYESIAGGFNSQAYTKEYAKRESFERIFDESKKSLNDKISYEYNHFIDDMNETYRHTQEKIIRVAENGEIVSKKDIHDGGFEELTNNIMNMVKSKVGNFCDKSDIVDKYTVDRYPEIEKINKKIKRGKRFFYFFPFLAFIIAVVGIYCFSYFSTSEQSATAENNMTAAENTKTEKTSEQTSENELTDTVKTAVKAESLDKATDFVKKVFVDINTAINTILTFAQGFILIFIAIIVIILALYIFYIKFVIHIYNKKRDKLYEKKTSEFERELLNNFFTVLTIECEKNYKTFYSEYDSAFMAKDAQLFEKVGIGTIIDEILTELEEI